MTGEMSGLLLKSRFGAQDARTDKVAAGGNIGRHFIFGVGQLAGCMTPKGVTRRASIGQNSALPSLSTTISTS